MIRQQGQGCGALLAAGFEAVVLLVQIPAHAETLSCDGRAFLYALDRGIGWA
jgi:hypothetical protein